MKGKDSPNGGIGSQIWLAWDGFWQRTNIVGINNAGNSRNSVLRRIIWVVIFCTFLLFTVWGVSGVIKEYFSYPVDTKVVVKHLDRVEFPGVTVCNQNRVNCENLLSTICSCLNDTIECTTNDTDTMNNIAALGDCTNNKFTKELDWWNDAPCNKGKGVKPANNGAASPVRGKRNSGGSRNGGRGNGLYGENRQGESNGQKQGSQPVDRNRVFDNKARPEQVEAEWIFVHQFMSLNENLRKRIGHSFDSFVKSCIFRGKDCTDATLFEINNYPNYGNCFTFNSAFNRSGSRSYVTSLTAPNFGLYLVLQLDQKNYLRKGMTKQAGARIAIHAPKLKGLVDEYGFDLSPNLHTQIAIQEQNITRKPEPYETKCWKNWKDSNYSDYYSNESEYYTLAQCQRTCLYDTIASTCECAHPLYMDNDLMRSKYAICKMTEGAEDSNCTTTTIKQLDTGIRTCNCNVACQESAFTLQLSSSEWPSNQYVCEVMRDFGFFDDSSSSADSLTSSPNSKGNGNRRQKRQNGQANNNNGASDDKTEEEDKPCGTDQDKNRMAKNLLQLNVFFQTLNVQTITEDPKYEGITSVVSSLGGALSLYLGISVAMLFEVVEFVVDLLMGVFHSCNRGKKYH